MWTVVLIVLLNTIPQLKDVVPSAFLDTATAILGALAVYFKVTPSQPY